MSSAPTTASRGKVYKINHEQALDHLKFLDAHLEKRKVDPVSFATWIKSIPTERLVYPPLGDSVWFPGRVHIGTYVSEFEGPWAAYGYVRRNATEDRTSVCLYVHETDVVGKLVAIRDLTEVKLLPWVMVASRKAKKTYTQSQINYVVRLALSYNGYFDGSLTIEDAEAGKVKHVHEPVITSIWEDTTEKRQKKAMVNDGPSTPRESKRKQTDDSEISSDTPHSSSKRVQYQEEAVSTRDERTGLGRVRDRATMVPSLQQEIVKLNGQVSELNAEKIEHKNQLSVMTDENNRLKDSLATAKETTADQAAQLLTLKHQNERLGHLERGVGKYVPEILESLADNYQWEYPELSRNEAQNKAREDCQRDFGPRFNICSGATPGP